MSPPAFLTPCSLCARHFRASEPICPFCFAKRASSAMAMALAIGGAVSLGGCRDATPPAGSSSSSSGTSVQDLTVSDAGPAPDAAVLSPPRPVYGPAAGFPGDRIPGLRGEVAIGPVTASTPVPNVDKEMALAQPVLQTCYQTGLRRIPTMAGTLDVTMSVKPDGKVSSVKVDGDIDEKVRACMVARLELCTFGASASASTLTTKLTLTSKHD